MNLDFKTSLIKMLSTVHKIAKSLIILVSGFPSQNILTNFSKAYAPK